MPSTPEVTRRMTAGATKSDSMSAAENSRGWNSLALGDPYQVLGIDQSNITVQLLKIDMLIQKDPKPPSFPSRRCNGCGLELEPTSTRRWSVNLIPLGATARYDCAFCATVFEVRSMWHLAVLISALGLLLWSYERILVSSAFAQVVALTVVIYMLYAIVTDVLDRIRNPTWLNSEI